MKIGILTYYGDLNCGTNLQAYATLQAVKSVYPNDSVEIIPFHGFRPRVIPYKSFSPVSIYKDLKRINKYYLFKKEILHVIEKDRVITNVPAALRYISERKYDVIYVGADTLLELNRLPSSCDGLSAYWLKDVKAKKILIAASSKNTEYEKLQPNQKEEMEIAINQFSYLGVRDHATKELFSHFIDQEQIMCVPDPTFNMDIDYFYIENYLKRKHIVIPSKSIFIHTFGDDHWADAIAKTWKNENYQIIAPRPAKWANLCLNDMSPLEQLGIYRYVEFAVTHRFHDGVFCLKNNTPFILYEKGDNHATIGGDSKFTSLLKDFDLYPENFVDRGVAITANLLLSKTQTAIVNFRQKERSIKNKLQIKSDEYLNFLKTTL